MFNCWITSQNKLYGFIWQERFVSLELDHPQTQTGTTHPTPPQNLTYGQYFSKKLPTWIDINVEMCFTVIDDAPHHDRGHLT